MTESKKPAAKAAVAVKPAQAEAVEPAAESAPELRSAAGSTDPAVHKLLADRQTYALNGDTDSVARIDAELVKLGFAL